MEPTNEQILLILAATLQRVPDRGLDELRQRFDHLGEDHACIAVLREELAERGLDRPSRN